MDKIFLSAADRQLIHELSHKGLKTPGIPQWHIARLALARSLQLRTPPDESFDNIGGDGKGVELHLEQVIGQGKPIAEDLSDIFRLLLSEYHGEDLFDDEEVFLRYLRRHIRRGLAEFQASWRQGNDFHDYLYNEMFHVESPPAADSSHARHERLESALSEIEVRAKRLDIASGPRLDRVTLKLEDAGDFERLRRSLDRLEFLTGIRPLNLVEGLGERQAGIDVPRDESDWQFPSISDLDLKLLAPGSLPVSPGLSVTGQPIVFDLAETPHLFVAGTTGSGKSICLHSLIYCLLMNSVDVDLVLADPKKIEFALYKDLNCLWNGLVVSETNEILETLDALVNEMEIRQSLLLDANVSNISQAQSQGVNLRRIVVIIEELADLFLQDDRASISCIRLAQKARATGIHLLLATQRPDADTFPGLLRSNVPSRIALTVRTSRESKIIIDETGAERLLGKGDMIIRLLQGESIRGHGFHVGPNDIINAIDTANKRTLTYSKR